MDSGAKQIRNRRVSIAEAMKILNVSRSTIYALVKRGDLPPLRKYGPKLSGWPLEVFEEALG